MADLLARPANTVTSPALRTPPASAKSFLRVLAVVDGTECAGRVTKYLLDLHSRERTVEVILLNVQPMLADGRLRGYGSFRRNEVEDRLINDLGRRIVSSASRQLAAANIPNRQRVEIGAPTEIIVRCAAEERCDLVVLAEREPGAFRRWLMRTTGVAISSVASVVVHFANSPVVIAK